MTYDITLLRDSEAFQVTVDYRAMPLISSLKDQISELRRELREFKQQF